jgi:REP element-mobilizing transposase RayT
MPTSRQPLIIAHHLMWTLYGWWLPNDPRGSTSHTIRNDLVAELGEVHYGRKRIQPAGKCIRTFYDQAAGVLKHPLMAFSLDEFPNVAAALGDAIHQCNYTCYATAVMPDHVHLVIRKHRHLAEEMIENIQSLSRKRLIEAGLRVSNHPTWTHGGWKVFLDHPQEVRRTIDYVENNPLKMRLPLQRWPFVVEYNDWPLHPGHSPNSPYAQALNRAGRYPHAR